MIDSELLLVQSSPEEDSGKAADSLQHLSWLSRFRTNQSRGLVNSLLRRGSSTVARGPRAELCGVDGWLCEGFNSSSEKRWQRCLIKQQKSFNERRQGPYLQKHPSGHAASLLVGDGRCQLTLLCISAAKQTIKQSGKQFR